MKKNAFTLIELLAVILILGIIALIAIPTVNKILDESKKGAFKSTLNEINKSVENQCNVEQIKNLEPNTYYTITNGFISPSVNIKGSLPDGQIFVDSKCNVTFNLHNQNYTGIKYTSDGEIIISKGGGGNDIHTPIIKEIDKTKSFVGYYADIDGNGTVDGVIFADLITGATKGKQWINENGYYEISIINSNYVQNYYIS